MTRPVRHRPLRWIGTVGKAAMVLIVVIALALSDGVRHVMSPSGPVFAPSGGAGLP